MSWGVKSWIIHDTDRLLCLITRRDIDFQWVHDLAIIISMCFGRMCCIFAGFEINLQIIRDRHVMIFINFTAPFCDTIGYCYLY